MRKIAHEVLESVVLRGERRSRSPFPLPKVIYACAQSPNERFLDVSDPAQLAEILKIRAPKNRARHDFPGKSIQIHHT